MTLRVAAFTGGAAVPGSRFRVRQFIEPLRALGVELVEFFPGLGAYPPTRRAIRPLWAAGTLCQRLPAVLRSHLFDLTLFQRELLSTFLTFERFTGRPRILDVDDAVWLHRRGGFVPRLARLCDRVICGNDFLAENFRRWNPNVTVLPTAVDTDRFRPPALRPGRPVLGWVGTSGGEFLGPIQPALREVFRKHPDATLRVVSDRPPRLADLQPEKIEFVRWSEAAEVRLLQEMTVGLMPLTDDLWGRGKCAYKMLLYMACGLPVVVSPVGMNRDVLALGEIGFGAARLADWFESLDLLLSDPDQAAAMGRAGRETVVRQFSLPTLAPRLAEILRETAARPGRATSPELVS